jgi:Tfp pilus assembly protein PilE
MRPAPGKSKAGFSLAELLLIMVIITVLAGVAIPSLRRAVDRAAAAKIMTDVRGVTLAVRSYMEANNGAIPTGAAWGKVPPSLAPYLPDGMTFAYKSTTYRVVVQKARGTVRLQIRYPSNDPVGLALQRFRGPDITWTRTLTTVWIQR